MNRLIIFSTKTMGERRHRSILFTSLSRYGEWDPSQWGWSTYFFPHNPTVCGLDAAGDWLVIAAGAWL